MTVSLLALERVDPCTDPRWRALMTGGRGSLFGSPPWITAITQTYGFEVHANVLVNGQGRPTAGIAYAMVDDARGRRLVSLPFSDRLDPVVDDRAEWEHLVGGLLEHGLPLTLRCLDAHIPVQDARFVTTASAVWHATDLSRSEDEILAGFSAVARRNIRAAAQRHGVRVRIGTDLEDVRAFHQLHRHLRKYKYRMLAPPVEFFERLWYQFAPSGSIAVALADHDGGVIAGALCLVWEGVFYYKFGASVPQRLVVRPNELVAWEAMAHGRRHGCRLYDWGLSDLDQPGLVAFKRKFATEERHITMLKHSPEGERDAGRHATALIGQLVELLTREDVPDEVTQRAGEILYGVFC